MDHLLLLPYREPGGGGPPGFTPSGVQQFLYSGQTPYTRRIGTQSYVADKSSSGDYRNAPQLGRCYLFDGTDDYCTRGARLTTGSPTALTLSAWIKTSDTGYSCIAAEWNGTGNNWSWATTITNGTSGKLTVYLSSNGSTIHKQYNSAATITDDVWHHIAFTFDAGTLKLYIDGVEDTPTKVSDLACASLYNSTANFGLSLLDGGTTWVLNGRQFDTLVYQQALTADEITYLYTFGASGTAPGLSNLKGWYKCDDTHPTLAYDSSGNGNHLTKTGITTSTFHSTSATLPYSYQNRIGYTDDVTNGLVPRDESDTANDVTGATLEYTGRTHYDGELGGLPGMTFNGTSEYLESGTVSITGDWTVMAWVYRTGSSGVQYFLSLKAGSYFGSIAANVNGSPWLFFDGSTTLLGTNLGAPAWHHLAVTKSGTTYTLYKNGVSDGSGTKNDIDIDKIIVGRRGDASNYLQGSVFDVRLFSAALSSGDIQTCYAGGKVTTGLVEQWPLCEGSGTTIYGTEGNTLTLTSAAPATVHATKNTINDHLIRYGGRLDSGVYIPGDLDGLLAANGAALTFGPGVLPDDGSFVNRKPAAYPLLNDVETSHGSLNTSEEVGDATTSPNSATDTGTTRHSFNTPDP